jgi:hypothetical protein
MRKIGKYDRGNKVPRPLNWQKDGIVQPSALAALNQIIGNDKVETIEDILSEDQEEATLADQFIASTHTEGTQFKGRFRKDVIDAVIRYRAEMRHAHHFVLTDEFVEMATHMASVKAEKTLARLQYATLPYDTTWIEYNLHAKVRTIRQIHHIDNPDYSDVATRMGYLLQRIDDTSALCTPVSNSGELVTPHLTAYLFSTVERDFTLTNRSYFGALPIVLAAENEPTRDTHQTISNAQMQKEALQDSAGKASMWGYTTEPGNRMVAGLGDGMSTPRFLLRHGDIALTRLHAAYYPAFNSQGVVPKLSDLILAEAGEFAGTMRWLVTVLAMMNEVPISTSAVHPTSHMRAGRLHKNKLLDYHKVSLVLPKNNPIRYLQRKLSHAEITKRRAHEVRTHWRTYLHVGHCGREEHDWTYDHGEGYRLCGKCNAYGRLIHEHIRGDASLGWVRKDYVVKPTPGFTGNSNEEKPE